MEQNEFKQASLHTVIEVTLEEYVRECEQMGYHVDKCGYIGQILEKVEVSQDGCICLPGTKRL